MNKKYDIVIVGGGLVGLSLALALKNTDLSVAMIEIKPATVLTDEDVNSRSIALSYASMQIFSALGIWSTLKTHSTAIRNIHISDKGHFGVTRISAQELAVDALGYSVQAKRIALTLEQQLANQHNVSVYRPAELKNIDLDARQLSVVYAEKTVKLQANLIVAADGQDSSVKKHLGIANQVIDYNQSALVSNVNLDRDHKAIAYERFTQQGPIALLPIDTQRMALVWTDTPQRIKQLMAQDEQTLLANLQKHVGYRAGQFIALSQRFSYSVNFVKADEQIRPGLLLLGNAAHSLHPVAAQGFNLGLRNVKRVAKCLSESTQLLGSLSQLQTCLQHCRADQQQTIGFTNCLLDIFSHQHFPITPLRGMGLSVLNNLPYLKNLIARRAMGLRDDS